MVKFCVRRWKTVKILSPEVKNGLIILKNVAEGPFQKKCIRAPRTLKPRLHRTVFNRLARFLALDRSLSFDYNELSQTFEPNHCFVTEYEYNLKQNNSNNKLKNKAVSNVRELLTSSPNPRVHVCALAASIVLLGKVMQLWVRLAVDRPRSWTPFC